MKLTPESEGRPRRMVCPEETAFLDLVRTVEMLSRPLAQLLKTGDLSPAQYNVLRILRGSPGGLTLRRNRRSHDFAGFGRHAPARPFGKAETGLPLPGKPRTAA